MAAGADMDGTDYNRLDLTGPSLGDRKRRPGYPRLVKENDFLARIPMKGRIGSLNAWWLPESLCTRWSGRGQGEGMQEILLVDGYNIIHAWRI